MEDTGSKYDSFCDTPSSAVEIAPDTNFQDKKLEDLLRILREGSPGLNRNVDSGKRTKYVKKADFPICSTYCQDVCTDYCSSVCSSECSADCIGSDYCVLVCNRVCHDVGCGEYSIGSNTFIKKDRVNCTIVSGDMYEDCGRVSINPVRNSYSLADATAPSLTVGNEALASTWTTMKGHVNFVYQVYHESCTSGYCEVDGCVGDCPREGCSPYCAPDCLVYALSVGSINPSLDIPTATADSTVISSSTRSWLEFSDKLSNDYCNTVTPSSDCHTVCDPYSEGSCTTDCHIICESVCHTVCTNYDCTSYCTLDCGSDCMSYCTEFCRSVCYEICTVICDPNECPPDSCTLYCDADECTAF